MGLVEEVSPWPRALRLQRPTSSQLDMEMLVDGGGRSVDRDCVLVSALCRPWSTLLLTNGGYIQVVNGDGKNQLDNHAYHGYSHSYYTVVGCPSPPT